ncbi:MAG: transferrin-binding protein-like solute binding protein, partial [Alphaproteobacteria bacterium]|nr:transferrin-binding protein-like solute binding protein [Alphaproteobacteria bacterium]
MRQLIFSTITLLLFAITLTACGGGGGGGADAGGGGGDTPAPAPITCETDISKCADTEETFNLISVFDTIEAITQPDIEWNGFDSLNAVSAGALADTDSNATKSVTLGVVGVSLNDNIYYRREATNIDWQIDGDNNPKGLQIAQRITLSRITWPTVALTFNSDGHISGVTVNYLTNSYTATGTGDAKSFTGAYDSDYTDADSSNTALKVNIAVDRSTIFGFDSAYMAHIKWDSKQEADFTISTASKATEYNIKGATITGFETTTLPTTNQATFTGAGTGVYSVFDTDNVQTTYNTSFTAIAIVDFSSSNVDFTTTGTACTDTNCALTAADKNALNLSTENISFISGTNNISSDINAGTLSGTLDAKFYGDNGDGANEFGGTFALTEANKRYYYGAFGAQRGLLVPTQNYQTLTSLEDPKRIHDTAGTPLDPSDDVGRTNIALAIDSLVEITRSTDGTSITNKNIYGGLVQFDYANDNSGDYAPNSLKYYFDNRIYTVTNGGSGGTDRHITATSVNGVTSNDGSAPKELRFNRYSFFGFTSDYMSALQWLVDPTDANSFGYGIAGFATAGNAITKSGRTIFTGKGWGNYSDATENDDMFYTITANVDFSTRKVTLASTDTCAANELPSCTGSNPRPHLNFTGDTTYEAGSNQLIFSTVTTAGDVNNFPLSGTANAKFYGTGTDVATELGGTFNLSNIDGNAIAGYVGFFGTQRGYLIDANDITTETEIAGETVPATFNANGITSFVDPNRVSTTGNAFEVASIVQITKNNQDNTITNEKISGGVAQFDYNGVNFKNMDFAIYFADKKYVTTGGTSTATLIAVSASNISVAGDADVPDILELHRDDAKFSFEPNYMARVYWNVDETDYDAFGYGITGFATDGTDILTADNPILAGITQPITFTGEGQGEYHDKASQAVGNIHYFIITANVDFSNQTIGLTSSQTCDGSSITSSNFCPSTNNGEFQAFHLDFTGELSYAAGTNAISGGITTAGADEDFG